jgi:hypothetical protein
LARLEKEFRHPDAAELLKVILRDRVKFLCRTAAKILLLLGSSAFATIQKSLWGSDTRLRGSALEALESLKVEGLKQTVKLFEPLLSDFTSADKLKLFKNEIELAEVSVQEVLKNSLEAEDEWEREIALAIV